MQAQSSGFKIGVDLDGTISEYPEFFRLFTRAMAEAGCQIHIITDRAPGTHDHVKAELQAYDITYHTIEITGDKARYILEQSINVLFDDVDDYFVDLPEEVAVFKIRQKYNFDFAARRWRNSTE
jgi:uncharacterized HAD superfamily protein